MAAAPDASPAPFAVEWREAFCVGNEVLDREHRRLFALAMALNLDTVQQTVEQLLDHVVTHFSHEQEIMETAGYPAFEAHLRLHEAFANQMADFLMDGDGWTEDRVQALRRFLNKWLIGHVLTHDLRFGKWLAAKNQAAPGPAKTGLVARLFR